MSELALKRHPDAGKRTAIHAGDSVAQMAAVDAATDSYPELIYSDFKDREKSADNSADNYECVDMFARRFEGGELINNCVELPCDDDPFGCCEIFPMQGTACQADRFGASRTSWHRPGDRPQILSASQLRSMLDAVRRGRDSSTGASFLAGAGENS